MRDITENNTCPVCKCEIAPIENVASPLGYRTEYNIEQDFDGRFEWMPKTSETKIDSEQTDILLKRVINSNLLIGNNEIPEKGVVTTINTNKGKLFSLVPSKKEEGWYDPDYVIGKSDFNFDESSRKEFALISSKITGVLEICIDSTNKDLILTPIHTYNESIIEIEEERLNALKGAFISWGNLLRKAATDYLDIETTELTVDYFVKRESDCVRAGIFMVEKLENGAGYTSFLGEAEDDIKREVFFNKLLKNGTLYNKLTEKDHQNFCDCSCYDCLRDYYNQRYHSLLDWRLALDLAQVSGSKDFVPEIMDKNGYWYNLIKERLETLLQQENNKKPD